MIFASDNWAGAHPAIAQALADHAGGHAHAYGDSDLDHAVRRRFCEIFDKDVAVFFVSTGTAANALSLASVSRPGGVAFCHAEAHLVEDEAGATEYLTGGTRLACVGGPLGRIDPQALEAAIRRYPPEFLHAGRPVAVSVTQASEIGTVYAPDELDAIAAVAKEHGLAVHMDGARFTNALVSLDLSPAEMTWKRGVDLLSFGGTKNGCWCAEAVVLFDPAQAGEFAFLHKRAAQLLSKSRFVAAQFQAYFDDDLWLDNARHANAMAARLAECVKRSGSARLAWEPQANEVFAVMAGATAKQLTDAGVAFYDWNAPEGFQGIMAMDERICRFVTGFATTAEEIDRFSGLIA
ncbi:MAG: low specificity L-threonine aldolase [Nitratireductor sp.]|uniref:threonine aldolase family protein n=1 Tax=Roseitalea porphyridii TaxID=1852022 RepID=UPI0032F05889